MSAEGSNILICTVGYVKKAGFKAGKKFNLSRRLALNHDEKNAKNFLCALFIIARA